MAVRGVMKKKLLIGLVLLLAVFCLAAAALAENDPITVDMQLSATKLSAPQNITVSIKVSNSGEGDMPGPVTLYYPGGKQVAEFGSPVLSVGASHEWTGTWRVTQKQLEDGKLTFTIKYSTYNESGELVNKKKSFSRKLTYTGATASLEVNRTITPTTAGKGQEVTVSYELMNTGNVDITDVTIKEHASISTKTANVGTVPAGSKVTHTFTVTMNKSNLTSQSVITYKAAGKTQTVKKEAATVKYGEVKLSASMVSDTKGGMEGSTAKLTITLKNTGDTDYTDVTLVEPTLGTIASGITVPAKSSVTQEKELTISDTGTYQVTVTGMGADGMEVTTATGRVTITALKADDVIDLSVNVEADRLQVYTIPANVRFTVSVTNNGTKDVKNVNVYAVDTRVRSFELIPAGATKTFEIDTSISMAGTFAFNARTTNALNETSRFNSNELQIAHVAPTAEPTAAPVVTVPAPQYVDIPTMDDLDTEQLDNLTRILSYARYVLVGLLGVVGLLTVLGIIGAIRKSRVKNALDVNGSRSYYTDMGKNRSLIVEPEQPKVEEETPAEPEITDAPAEPEEAPVAETSTDAMAEALSRIYAAGTAETPDITVEDVPADQEPAPVEGEDAVHHRGHRK